MDENLTPTNISLCGALDLLSVILRVTEDKEEKLRARYGVPTKYRHCLECGKIIHPYENRHQNLWYKHGFCSALHSQLYRRILVACDQCGRLFMRQQSVLQNRIARDGYQHVFCSRSCRDLWKKGKVIVHGHFKAA